MQLEPCKIACIKHSFIFYSVFRKLLIYDPSRGCNRVEMWKQPQHTMTSTAQQLQVDPTLKALKPKTPSQKQDSNALSFDMYLQVNTWYQRKISLRSEGRGEEGKMKDSHWVFCTEKYKKGIRSAEGSSRITPVLVEPKSPINRPVQTRAIGEQLCILSLELWYKSSCFPDFISVFLRCCQL